MLCRKARRRRRKAAANAHCCPSASLAWLMSPSTEPLQGQGCAPRRRARRGHVPSKPSRCRQEKQEGRGSRLSTSPSLLAPELRESQEFSNILLLLDRNPRFGQHREDGQATASPSAEGRTGIASLPRNTDSLYKVPLNPYPQKGPDLGLIHLSCSGGAILPAAAALLSSRESGSRVAEPGWSRNPSNAGYAVSSSSPPKGQVSN